LQLVVELKGLFKKLSVLVCSLKKHLFCYNSSKCEFKKLFLQNDLKDMAVLIWVRLQITQQQQHPQQQQQSKTDNKL